MIIQEFEDHLRLITQHDHALISGDFAAQWAFEADGERPDDVLIMATRLHDMAWIDADARPRFMPEPHRPYDFMAYPETPKARLYEQGIRAIAALHPYAALLHSHHFMAFVPEERHPDFAARQRLLRHELTAQAERRGFDCSRVSRDLELLRVFDVLSLIVCMLHPATPRSQHPRWLTPSPLLEKRGLNVSFDGNRLALTPNPFAEPFTLRLPYKEVALQPDGSIEPTELYAAEERVQLIEVQAGR